MNLCAFCLQKNLKTFVLTVLFILLSAFSSSAFYSKGRVNNDINYSELKVDYRENLNGNTPWKVSGYLKNKTSKPIDFFAKLYFNNYFNRQTGSASIRVTIPANNKAWFDDYIHELGKEGFSESKLVWDVHSPKPDVKVRTKSKDEPVKSYSKHRKLRNGYQFTGKGNVITKKIHLERGMLKAKSSYSGDGHFSVELLKENGELNKLLANEIGSYSGSTGEHIRTAGYYYLKIDGIGSWRVELEMPSLKVKTASAPTPVVSYDDTTPQYDINMKNGQIISVDSYEDMGSTISFTRFGAKVSLKKNKIKEIVKK